tara:strand:+ start:176 stop:826 length:651 start_codon:yes stop_codon:yes gene_type:complete
MRFAGDESVLEKVNRIKQASATGSIPYLTPYMASQQSGDSEYENRYSDNYYENRYSNSPYIDYEAKMKELDDIVRNRKSWAASQAEDPVDTVEPVAAVDPVDPEPEDTRTDGRKFMEKLYKKSLDAGMSLEAAMKLNPAQTPGGYARAFGKCRTVKYTDKYPESSGGIPSDCYFPEESGLEGSDFYKVGGGGRKSAPKGRTKKASRSGGGVGHGGG